jgi:hypothetical protein
MKRLLGALLALSTMCVTANDFANVGIDRAKINGGDRHTYYNAEVEKLNDNSWRFISNTNKKDCPPREGKWTEWNCRRADVQLVEWYQKEATMKYEFDFKVEKYPSWPSPYFIIILQDWRKQNARDSMGRHPITTLKLKNYNGAMYIGHFDNAWQWEYDFAADNNHDDSVHSIPDWNRGCWGDAPHPNDGVHHQENRCNGAFRIEMNQSYHVELIISLTGVKFIVDGNVVSDVDYKTKSNLEWSYIKWGMYWDENYNTMQEESERTIFSIESFVRSIKIKPSA